MTVKRLLFRGVLAAFYVLVLGEVIVRGISFVIPIFPLETESYARQLTSPSEIQNVPYVHKSDSSARVMGVDITLNRHGHRNPMENRYLTADHDKTLAFLGSSLTLGWGVPETDTFAAQTSKSWTNQKSSGSAATYVNLGVAGFTVNNSISLYRAQSHLLKPKVLILQVFPGDLFDNGMIKDSGILSRSHFWLLLQNKFATALASGGGSLETYYANLLSSKNEEISKLIDNIRWLKTHSEENNAIFILLIIPDLFSFSDSGQNIHREFEKLFSEFSDNIVDTFPALRSAFAKDPRSAWVSAEDRHPNSAAHAIISNVLHEHLHKTLK